MPPARTCECGTCKKCKHREYMNDYYRRNPEKVRASSIASRERRVEKARAYDSARAKQRRDAVPAEKKRAREYIENAVYYGRLTKLPCELCGDEKTEGHHDDYSKPKDVRWLCHRHHMELHRPVAA